MIVSLALFAQLAASCGPAVHVDTLAAIARTESGFHSGAINDNTDKRSYLPRTREEAIALATDLITVKRHSVDLGLMQISSANLSGLRMTVADAFDPCKSINGGARVLEAAYKAPPRGRTHSRCCCRRCRATTQATPSADSPMAMSPRFKPLPNRSCLRSA